MPSGIDAALKSLKADAMMPAPTKVNYNGFEPEKKKKPEITEATIDPSEIGLEKCQKIVKEQEFKIRKLKEKMAGIAPTKKNKAEIAAVKEQVEELQADGNYRAAMNYVRKVEEDERDKRRAEREKDDEEALVGGLGKKKGPTGPSEPAPKKQAASSAEVQEVAGDFDADAEVAAVVKSAVEGSEDALAQLQKGAGAGSYKSAIKAEVASIASAAAELISAKMKRAATRDVALKTLRALSWNPPATLRALPAMLLLLEETKLKGEPGGTAADLCRVVCSCGPKNSAVPEAVFPVLLAHGISSVYLSYFSRFEKELRDELKVEEEQVLRFLCAITASREPLPIEFASKIFVPGGRSLTTQRRVNKAIACISTLLPIRDGHIHFFHKSVKDWLTGASCYSQHDFIVDEREGHEILFKLCSTEMENVKGKGFQEPKFENPERYALQHGVQHMLEMEDSSNKLKDFNLNDGVNDYVTDLKLIYAKLCVNSTAATNDLVSAQKHVKAVWINDQILSLLNSLLNLLRKHSYVLRDYPHLFIQCLLNEGGPELSSKAAKIFESHLTVLPHMEYTGKDEHKGADQARFYCSGEVVCFDVSPQLDYMVCECRDATVHLWSLQTGNREWVRPSLTKREFFKPSELIHTAYRLINDCLSFYRCVVFHPNGESVLPGTLQRAYNLNGELKDLFPDSDCSFSNCAFTADKERIFTDFPRDGQMLILWSMKNGEPLRRVRWMEEIASFAIAQNLTVIAISDMAGRVVLIDPQKECSWQVLLCRDVVCGLLHFTSDENTLVCGFLRLTIEELNGVGAYGFHFSQPPTFISLTPLKEVLNSTSSRPLPFLPLQKMRFVLWPCNPCNLSSHDFTEQTSSSCWVDRVHGLFPSLSAGSYMNLSDETVLISSPGNSHVTMINTTLLNEETDPGLVKKRVEEIVFAPEADFIYSMVHFLEKPDTSSTVRRVEVTVWRMSSGKVTRKEAFSTRVTLIPTKLGIVVLRGGDAELRNFELSKVIRVLTKLKGAGNLFPISDTTIACCKTVRRCLRPVGELLKTPGQPSRSNAVSELKKLIEHDELSQHVVSKSVKAAMDLVRDMDASIKQFDESLDDLIACCEVRRPSLCYTPVWMEFEKSDFQSSAACDDASELNISLALQASAEVQQDPVESFFKVEGKIIPLNGMQPAGPQDDSPFAIVFKVFNVSSDVFESSFETIFVDDCEGCITAVSSNMQHQFLVCICLETYDKGRVDENVSITLRSDGSTLWRRDSLWADTERNPSHLLTWRTGMRFSPQNDFVVTWNSLARGRGLHILDARTGKTCHIFLKTVDDIVDCKFVENEYLVCCRKENFLTLFDIRKGVLLSLLDIGEQAFSLGACLHHPLVAVGLENSKLRFVRVHLPGKSQKKTGGQSSKLQKEIEV